MSFSITYGALQSLTIIVLSPFISVKMYLELKNWKKKKRKRKVHLMWIPNLSEHKKEGSLNNFSILDYQRSAYFRCNIYVYA